MKATPAPLFNILATLIPLACAAYAALKYSQASADTIGGAIGNALGAYLLFAVACAVGETLAILALVRGERPTWLSLLAVLLNLTAILPPLWFVLFRK